MKIRTLGTLSVLTASLLAVAGCDRAGRDDVAGNDTQYPRKVDRPATATPPDAPGSMTQSPSTSPMGQAPQASDDSATTAKVKAALAADSAVNGTGVSVETSGGKVTLTGALPQSQIERVVQIARRVDGVRDVDNRLAATG